MIAMTPNVSASMVSMLASPTAFWSVVVADGPATYALTPGGAGTLLTIVRTASTDSLASASP